MSRFVSVRLSTVKAKIRAGSGDYAADCARRRGENAEIRKPPKSVFLKRKMKMKTNTKMKMIVRPY